MSCENVLNGLILEKIFITHGKRLVSHDQQDSIYLDTSQNKSLGLHSNISLDLPPNIYLVRKKSTEN